VVIKKFGIDSRKLSVKIHPKNEQECPPPPSSDENRNSFEKTKAPKKQVLSLLKTSRAEKKEKRSQRNRNAPTPHPFPSFGSRE